MTKGSVGLKEPVGHQAGLVNKGPVWCSRGRSGDQGAGAALVTRSFFLGDRGGVLV